MDTDFESVRSDIEAMRDALMALSRIPSAERRELAFSWLVERVQSDIQRLRRDEHIERVADLVGHIFGEPSSVPSGRSPR